MGQGFHNYILYHLNNFKTGETRELKFVLESRLDYFNFTFNYLGSDEKNPTLTNYRLDIKSWILKLFADALSVQYDTKKRRLMKFDGLTNVSNKRGKAEHLVITYKYDG